MSVVNNHPLVVVRPAVELPKDDGPLLAGLGQAVGDDAADPLEYRALGLDVLPQGGVPVPDRRLERHEAGRDDGEVVAGHDHSGVRAERLRVT